MTQRVRGAGRGWAGCWHEVGGATDAAAGPAYQCLAVSTAARCPLPPSAPRGRSCRSTFRQRRWRLSTLLPIRQTARTACACTRPPAATRVRCAGRGQRVEGGGRGSRDRLVRAGVMDGHAPLCTQPWGALRSQAGLLRDPHPPARPCPLDPPPPACYLLNQPVPSFLRLPPHARGRCPPRARTEPTRTLTLDMAVRASAVTVHKAALGQEEGVDELFDGGGSGLTGTTASAPGTATAGGASARAAWAPPQAQQQQRLARQGSSGTGLGVHLPDEESSNLLDVSAGMGAKRRSGGLPRFLLLLHTRLLPSPASAPQPPALPYPPARSAGPDGAGGAASAAPAHHCRGRGDGDAGQPGGGGGRRRRRRPRC